MVGLSFFSYLFIKTCQRKDPAWVSKLLPFALILVPAAFGYLLYTGDAKSAKATMGSIENFVWILSGSVLVYLIYMLGRSASGGFVRVYLLFQIAAFFAILWKVFGAMGLNYAVREIFETAFGLFAALAVYRLRMILKSISKLHGNA